MTSIFKRLFTSIKNALKIYDILMVSPVINIYARNDRRTTIEIYYNIKYLEK